MSRSVIDLQEIADYWIARIDHLLQGCVRDRDCMPEQQSIDVPFHVFMADDIGMVEKIYAKANLPLTDSARAELTAFMDANPRGKHGQVVYDLKGDFGIDPDTLRKQFDFYFQRFPVRPEVKS